MALDPQMVGKVLTVGTARVLERAGSGLGLSAVLSANVPRRPNGSRYRLTWAPSGNEWLSQPMMLSVSPGQEIVFSDVPACDSPGWRLDGAPVAGVAFTYSVRLGLAIQGYGCGPDPALGFSVTVGPFVIRESDTSPIDVDSLVTVTGSAGSPVSVVDAWTEKIEQALALAEQANATASEALALVGTGTGGGGTQRGVALFTGSGDPADPYPGAISGDVYLDLGTGQVWALGETTATAVTPPVTTMTPQ